MERRLPTVAEKQHETQYEVTEQLRQAAEAAIVATGSSASIAYLAQELIESKAELIAAITPHWQTLAIIRLLRQEKARYASRQRRNEPVFPEFEDQFNRVPQTVPIGKERRILKGKLTYTTAIEYTEQLRKRQHKDTRLTQALRMVELLREYSKENSRITWAEVVAKEAAKQPQGW